MRAVRFESGGAIKVVQLPNPQPGAEDVLVQVLAAGVCRTDLHLFDPALAAPLGCSGATAYRAVVAFGQAEEEDMVVIIGAGGVGLSAIQVSKAYNARVFAIEPRVEARKAALDCGADRAVGPDEAG